MHEVQIYSRSNCHLCDVALETLVELQKEFSFTIKKVIIDGNPELETLYGEEVPVTMIDGKRHDYFRVDRARFIEAVLHPHQ